MPPALCTSVCDVLLMMVVCVTILVTCWTDEDEDDDASIPAAVNWAADDEGDMRGVEDLRGRIESMAAEDEEREEGVMALLTVWETLKKWTDDTQKSSNASGLSDRAKSN